MWLALAIVGAVGTLLLALGLRGRRIDDHPLCRRCQYDLSGGTPADRPALCPECGADLSAARAIRRGQRRRRPLLLALGTSILLLTLAGGGLLGWTDARDFDWYPYKPLWLLKRDAIGTNAAIASASQQEILARLGDGELSQSQIHAIVTEALAAQADPQATWFTFWGDFVEVAWDMQRISDAQVREYVQNAVTQSLRLRLPGTMRRNTLVWVFLQQGPARVGSSSSIFRVQADWGELSADGQRLGAATGGSSGFGLSSSGGGSSGTTRAIPLPVGTHIVVQELRITVARHYSMDTVVVLEGWPLCLQTTIDVVGPEEPVIELVADESLREEIERAIEARICSVGDEGGRLRGLCMVTAAAPLPANVAFDILWRVKDRAEGREGQGVAAREWPVGAFAQEAGALMPLPLTGSRSAILDGLPRDTEHVDVILRPSATVAEQTGRLESIWDGEIIIQDIPLTWR